MPDTRHHDYDVVVALNYYTPYVSGVTEAARVTAEGLATRGWKVLVVCGRHEPGTPTHETINGVDVIRTRVAARIGKGIISPGFVPTVARWARRARLVHLHAPMLEAGAIAKAIGKDVPLVVTYQCDVDLPDSAFNRFQVRALDRSHRMAVRRSATVCVTSEDYAESSRLADDLRGRTTELPAPSLLRTGGSPAYRDGEGLHVGFLGRIVEEKGLEYLVRGFRELGPDARLVIGGDFAKVAGGSVVEKVRAAIDDDPRVRMLGFVPNEAVPDFYASIDVFALPSINSLEAFGIVQVEAMMLGVPSLASDLPGVRMPVRHTGFGAIVPPRDSGAIAAALREIEAADFDREAGSARARELYLAENVVERHAELFDRIAPTSP
ncbi:glycosyltransferase family 4 protein [Nocardioides nitrophenolicus]|uniref:glycosyltransferase family 4 protein n=1 Tax=Nocardioides nitrophenolicus TaxID=60489 RepID=UPI00195E66FF|nr:glycosyltransferase family 4 protein [Nocardioides nitrophenolicus]MBM7519384.1 glycosyltransferase involved in cell wall biosynthesis [Nocardioides nitrophenolicus]